MIFWYTCSGTYFYLVLDFLASISALLVSGWFFFGLFNQHHILQLNFHLFYQTHLVLLKISIFLWNMSCAVAILNGSLVNLYLTNRHVNVVKYSDFFNQVLGFGNLMLHLLRSYRVFVLVWEVCH